MATEAAAAALGLVDTAGTVVDPPMLPRPPALVGFGDNEEKLKGVEDVEDVEGVALGMVKVSEPAVLEPVPPEPTPPRALEEGELEGEAPPPEAPPPDASSQPYWPPPIGTQV